jgi:hypothetical protein
MVLINVVGFVAISFILIRIILLMQIDKKSKKNTFLKFLFGIYAIEAMIPIVRKADSIEEKKLISLANIFLVIFYVLSAMLLLMIWVRYR